MMSRVDFNNHLAHVSIINSTKGENEYVESIYSEKIIFV